MTAGGIEKGDFYCYEIKSCKEDFESKNGHNFLGDYNYYVMEEETYNKVKSKIPHYVGVLFPQEGKLRSIKKAKRWNRKRSTSEMLMMMFRSCNRDLLKSQDKE